MLLDENYLHHIVDNPVYLRPHSKTFLREAVNCDTAFLAAQSIIDYSLLVGMCGDRIVIGIIDYIRKFTFDKKVFPFVFVFYRHSEHSSHLMFSRRIQIPFTFYQKVFRIVLLFYILLLIYLDIKYFV